MKNLFLFIMFVSISVSNYANFLITTPESNEPINSITIKFNSDTSDYGKIELNFDSMDSLMNYDLSTLLEKHTFADDVCTASITVTVSVGVGSTYASATATVDGIPCDQIAQTIAALRKELKLALQ